MKFKVGDIITRKLVHSYQFATIKGINDTHYTIQWHPGEGEYIWPRYLLEDECTLSTISKIINLFELTNEEQNSKVV